MNKWMTGTMVVGGLLAAQGAAQAQEQGSSSVQMYGLLSAGIGYTSDEGGHALTHAISGSNQNPRIGFRGQEDLGDGLKALFVLENGFNVMTGTSAQSGRLFGRQSYVGLSSSDKGTLTLGRQYEAVKDYLGPVVIASNGVHIGDNDNGYNNLRVQNAIKYVSPTIRNLSFTGLYGYSENAENSSQNRAYSVGTGYKVDDFSWALAYTKFDYPNNPAAPDGALGNDYASPLLIFNKSALKGAAGVRSQAIAGTGGFYNVGRTKFGLLYTNVRYHYLDQSSLTLQNVDLNMNHKLTEALNLGASYFFTTGKYDVINKSPKWHQVNFQADYFLSKRTDVAVTWSYQKAAGDATFARVFGFGASQGKTQSVLIVGMRHYF
ncbi:MULTISPECIES: porin [unclassified Janthinobacterium]|uniref:porin n=1 Tax=unclassified Janthinobacterium TaxID=2610881 RepID=UPI0017F9EEF9|nr:MULTISPECIES: porin [unclassified Janthinobacterium]MBB5608551.1 putative porin [Janthinobacterium sp. S3T4]MBB5614072.1 putative porin [Janthinobacterium sp. S3M3]